MCFSNAYTFSFSIAVILADRACFKEAASNLCSGDGDFPIFSDDFDSPKRGKEKQRRNARGAAKPIAPMLKLFVLGKRNDLANSQKHPLLPQHLRKLTKQIPDYFHLTRTTM